MKKILIAEPQITELDIKYVIKALKSTWISGRGPYIERFEETFTEWLGADYGIATSSGTTALHLALAALEIGPKDEVIIPAFSMASLAFAVSYTGAKIRLVDAEQSTWNMDPHKIEEEITERTKAIMVMHTYGHPADMHPISKIAKKHGIYVIEDAAEAHGAEYKGKKVGTFGDISCFSFFANKIITTGEGGMIVTSDYQLAEKARLLRDMAFEKDTSRKFFHKHIGFNYRLTNIQAALGLAQLERINKFVRLRRRNAELYTKLLKEIEGIQPPPEANWAKNVYWMYSILIDEYDYGMNRDQLIKALEEKHDVETRPFFVPIHQQPVYRTFFKGKKYPVAERLSLSGLNLPSGNTLRANQVQYIANSIRSLRKCTSR